MKRSFITESLFVLVVISIPFFYLASVYAALPETVPVHFNMDGEPNGFDTKQSLWVFMGILATLSFGMYSLITNIQKIDPKRTAAQSPQLFRKIAATTLFIFTTVSMMIVYAAKGGGMQMNHFMLPFLGFVFLLLGNLMNSIKPNYFIGFRLPWTLESPENWRKTHQLVARVWVPGGLAIMLFSFFLPAREGYIFFLAVILIMIAIPTIYSYRYFKKHQNQ